MSIKIFLFLVISPLESDAGPVPPLYTEEVVRVPTTILVIKAVGTHLTLTFCQPSGFMKTVTVSRKPNTLKNEVCVEFCNRIYVFLIFLFTGHRKYS